MKSSERKTVLMRLKFSDGTSARSALEDVQRDLALSVNILRGRVTSEDASLELEVTGPVRRIKEFIRQSDTRRALVGTPSVGLI